MTGPEFRDACQQHKHLLYRFARRLTGSGIYNLYVLEEPDWRPTTAPGSFRIGSADKPEWAIRK